MRPAPAIVALFALFFGLAFAAPTPEARVEFNLPPQSADKALLAFAKQARVDILFSFDDLKRVQSNAVVGRYDPQQALEILLRGTGFAASRSGENKWIVAPTGPPAGKIKGKVLAPDGSPARRVRVIVTPLDRVNATNDAGEVEFSDIPPGRYTIVITAPNTHPIQIIDAVVLDRVTTQLGTHSLQRAEDPTRLDPFVVKADAPHARSLDHSEAQFGLRGAGGNLDLTRTESDALPYMIFNRSQITRSGVVNLNEFLQRELIDSSAGTLPPEQDPTSSVFSVGSTNLRLRGYDPDETVILVNGRRLPEIITSMGGKTLPPDVNLIPLSLVQQVEVLPVSASSLYTGNAVGGVINIVLRPGVDATATEVAATYTNSLGRFDAPQSSLSILHAESLLGGALRIRVNASFARSLPPTEAELGYHRRRDVIDPNPDLPVYRATPNIRTIRPALISYANTNSAIATEPSSWPKTQPPPPDLPPLFGPGSSPVTSVAPGANGTGGIAAFRGREGVRNQSFFDSMGAFSSSADSLDFPYGREQSRNTYYASVVHDTAPWLQLAADLTYSGTVIHRGYEVIPGDLVLKAGSAFNPFGQDVRVSLNETAPLLGENYSEARLMSASAVFGAVIRFPADWKLSMDTQYARNIFKYRGLVGANTARWQALVDQGVYNPLRDTQVYGPPKAFYDQALIYRGGPGRFVTLGDYDTMDFAARITNETLRLPTGSSIVNAGTDYRRNHLARYVDVHRYADGTPAEDPQDWAARALGRYSFFGELQTPIWPEKRLPKWLVKADTDLAIRYVASNSTKEANWAPTYGLKLVFPFGITFRGSITTSSRFPTPQMSRLQVSGSGGDGTTSVNRELIHDYVRNEDYTAVVDEVINPDLLSEDAVTQTAGLIVQRGQKHRFRAALDFVDTHKVNESVFIDKGMATLRESLWPERVVRAPAALGEAPGSGVIQKVYTGRANLSSRFSQDWTGSLDYRWSECFGGTFEAYARILYFQRYVTRALPNSPRVDQLTAPDSLVPVLKYRSNFGASWSNKLYTFGSDAHYFHSRLLPKAEWEAQGHDRIRPFWQFDAFTEADVAHFLPWKSNRYGLRAQLRVNNIFAAPFPKYVNDPYGAAVQPYGDWRGRVYSVSVTATF